MNESTVIALARECPYTSDELRGAYYEGFLKGAAAEREACAKVCDGWLHADGDRCAEAIRSLT